MKIIILIEQNPFFQSSAEANRWRTLIDGLTNLGVKIRLLITGGFYDPEEYEQLGLSGTIGNIEYKYINFLFQHNKWLRRINKYILSKFIQPFVQKRAKKLIWNSEVNVVWTSICLEHFQLAVTLKKENFPALFFIEVSEFFDIHQDKKKRAIDKKKLTKRQLFFETKAFHIYDVMAVMTKTLLKYFDAFTPPRPKLLHLPMTVDLARFDTKQDYPLRNDLKKPYITFIGAMSSKKDGVDILIDAFARIADEFPDVKLYLFGSQTSDTPGQLEQIKKHKLGNRIFYKGMVSRDEIPAIIMNAEVLLLPRPKSKQAQGGFPTKLGEYLATGNPICATHVGEIPDYLTHEESIYFAEPGSVSSFAKIMRQALSNPDKAKQIGRNGYKIAEKYFNKDVQAKKLYDFLVSNLK